MNTKVVVNKWRLGIEGIFRWQFRSFSTLGSQYTDSLITSDNGIRTRWGVPVCGQNSELAILGIQNDKLSLYWGITVCLGIWVPVHCLDQMSVYRDPSVIWFQCLSIRTGVCIPRSGFELSIYRLSQHVIDSFCGFGQLYVHNGQFWGLGIRTLVRVYRDPWD